MADKNISELQLRSAFSDACNVPVDDGTQTYRVTGAQIKEYAAGSNTVLDYSAIGSLGDSLNLVGCHYPNVSASGYNDVGFLYADTVAYWKFAAGSMSDEIGGANNLTNNGTATAINGFLNTAYGISLNGSSMYLTNATFLDSLAAFTAGIVFEMVFAATDGQGASSQYVFQKYNDSSNIMRLLIGSDGTLSFETVAAGTTKYATANLYMPNGATDWYHVVCAHDTTYGIRLFVNGALIGFDNSAGAKVLMSNGTGADFCLGRNQQAGTSYFGGKYSYVRVLNKLITQKHVDIMYSSLIPNTLTNADLNLDANVQVGGSTTFVKQYPIKGKIVAVDSTNIYLQGGFAKGLTSTDKIKIIAR